MSGIRIALVVAVLCTSCTREVQPCASLPVATNAPVVAHDPGRAQIACLADGTIWVEGKTIRVEDLTLRFWNRHRGTPCIPVAIRADKHLRFSVLWRILHSCGTPYSDDLMFAVLRGDLGPETEIAFTAFPPDEYLHYVAFTRTQDGVFWDGKDLSPEALEALLTRIAVLDLRTPVVIELVDEVSVQDVVTLMDLCCKIGLSDIHLQQKSPVPDFKGTENRGNNE